MSEVDEIGIAYQQHLNGVHLDCDYSKCLLAGEVDNFHFHDYDGPIVCCDDE